MTRPRPIPAASAGPSDSRTGVRRTSGTPVCRLEARRASGSARPPSRCRWESRSGGDRRFARRTRAPASPRSATGEPDAPAPPAIPARAASWSMPLRESDSVVRPALRPNRPPRPLGRRPPRSAHFAGARRRRPARRTALRLARCNDRRAPDTRVSTGTRIRSSWPDDVRLLIDRRVSARETAARREGRPVRSSCVRRRSAPPTAAAPASGRGRRRHPAWSSANAPARWTKRRRPR